MKRNQLTYAILIGTTIAVGLFTRSRFIPVIIYPYIGDYFFTIMYFFIVGFLFPTMKSLQAAIISIAICYITEILQLYQANWIEEIRDTTFGALTLGRGFLWSDMLMYALGGFIGYLLETKVMITKI